MSSSSLSWLIIIVVLSFLTLFAFDIRRGQRDQNDVFKVSNEEDVLSPFGSFCCGDDGYDDYGLKVVTASTTGIQHINIYQLLSRPCQ